MENHQRIILLKQTRETIIALGLIFVFIFGTFLFPAPILDSEFNKNVDINNKISMFDKDGVKRKNISISDVADINKPIITNNLLENKTLPVKKTGYYKITAYNSEVAQCDDSPCITANGFNLCEHGIEDTIATNFLPFGAKVRIPEMFGDKVFIVRDRMNSRYHDRLDIWMIKKQDAKEFGVKLAKVEVLE